MTDLHHTTPLSLFRQGHDTLEISKILGCSEATAYNEINRERQQDSERIKAVNNARYRKRMNDAEIRERVSAKRREYYLNVTKAKAQGVRS